MRIKERKKPFSGDGADAMIEKKNSKRRKKSGNDLITNSQLNIRPFFNITNTNHQKKKLRVLIISLLKFEKKKLFPTIKIFLKT
jgi:hypothetical protein